MEWIELGKLANIETGKLNANAADEDGKYPFFTCADEISRINDYKYDKECILIAGNGNLNVKYYSGKFNAYQRTYIVESKDKKILSTMYLYYFMNTYMDKLRELSIGGVIKYIKLGHLQDAKIPVPPMETQEKIVKVLDQAQALVDKRKEQIEALDQLIESIFYTMFGDPVRNEKGWEIKELGELIVGGIQNGLYKPSTFYTEDFEGTPIIRIDAFYEGKITNYKFKRVKCTDEEIRKFLVEDNEIVINRVNSIEYLGKNALIDKLEEKTIFESNMMKFKTDSTVVNNKFLIKIMNTDFLRGQILSRAKKAVNQASINQKDVKSFLIPIPPLDLQNEFAQKVEVIEKQKELLNQSLELLDENYKSIMDNAFKGQLFN